MYVLLNKHCFSLLKMLSPTNTDAFQHYKIYAAVFIDLSRFKLQSDHKCSHSIPLVVHMSTKGQRNDTLCFFINRDTNEFQRNLLANTSELKQTPFRIKIDTIEFILTPSRHTSSKFGFCMAGLAIDGLLTICIYMLETTEGNGFSIICYPSTVIACLLLVFELLFIADG